ncbi:MAG TPA: DEAD/DEAH box helicase [Fimbriimonadaceae bacterium]|nr:DEAD/DEAH box helicase [Fimbriimonadaceae bacterium]
MPQTSTPQGFRALALSPKLQDLLDKLAFVKPTPIQAAAMPVALQGRDLIGIAQTGTGKTLAFGLPIVHRLQETGGTKNERALFSTLTVQRLLLRGPALVLVPTRELAIQVDDHLRKIAGPFGLKTAVLIGGAPMGNQIRQLKVRPSIIVATPGRLLDHMEQRTISLSTVTIVVLDEADRMLDMGFAPAIRRILESTPRERQTMLFSATMPPEIATIASDYLRDPVRIEVEKPGTTIDLVSQELYVVEQPNKSDLLRELLQENHGTVLVFARTRHGAHKVARHVRSMGHSAAELHSDRTLAQRTSALQGFKSGEYRVLVATDIAARGIDVKGISLVINYDLPDNPDDYVHRIGRTGRAGETGRAITLATPEQSRDIHDIEKSIRAEIPLSDRSPLTISRHRPAAQRPRPAPQASRFRGPAPARGGARPRGLFGRSRR